MTGPIECAAADCYRQVARGQIACTAHARRIHPDTRRRLAAALRAGDLEAHAAAVRDAVEDMTGRKPA